MSNSAGSVKKSQIPYQGFPAQLPRHLVSLQIWNVHLVSFQVWCVHLDHTIHSLYWEEGPLSKAALDQCELQSEIYLGIAHNAPLASGWFNPPIKGQQRKWLPAAISRLPVTTFQLRVYITKYKLNT